MLHRVALIAVFFLGILASEAVLWGADQLLPPDSPGRDILLLRNGQTIEGRVTQTEGVYVVDLGDGQIRVKAADVDMVCGSLEEGYQRKRAAIQVGNVHHHLELAQWCLRHGLLGSAGVELADATAAEPDNPTLGALKHRLKLALEPPPSADRLGKPVAGPSNDELDRLVRSLPQGTVESFTQSVQPVLMNHCATGGCHGPQSDSGLRLYRATSGKSASRRLTQRNLSAVLPFVDRENPLESSLLTTPNGPHGTAKHAIFNEHQSAQYQRLVDWAGQLAGQPKSETPATLTPMPLEPVAPENGRTSPKVLSQEARRARPLPASAENKKAKRGAVPASFDEPADPHDPEVFNRRYAPQKPRKAE
jgi:hypothetical protein